MRINLHKLVLDGLSSRFQNMRIKYALKRGKRIGVIVSFRDKIDGKVKLGTSLCSGLDKFDRTMGVLFALKNSVDINNQDNLNLFLKRVPSSLKKDVYIQFDRARRYFIF